MAAQRMKLSHFKFDLPTEQIAQYPLDNRDDSRMMVVDRKTGKFEHNMLKDIIGMFDEGDVFVANDTKVFPARLCKTTTEYLRLGRFISSSFCQARGFQFKLIFRISFAIVYYLIILD